MANFHESLIDAVAEAVATARDYFDTDDITHLSAQRREHGDGSFSWTVRIADEFASFMTHLSDRASDCQGTPEQIAARIAERWVADWDEVQKDFSVGDYSLGSQDFMTRKN